MRGKVFRPQIIRFRGRLEGRVVGVDDKAAGRIDQLRNVFEVVIFLPDQVGPIAGQILLPVPALRPYRHLPIVDIGNVPGLVGIDVIDARQCQKPHRVQPFLQRCRPVQGVILHELPCLAHARIAHGIGAVFGLQHRSVVGELDLALGVPLERAEQLDPDGGRRDVHVPPRAVQPVLVCIVRVHLKHIDVRQIGLVHRIGPAQVLVVPVQDDRCPGKHAACDVEAFFAFQPRLIPGNGPGIGLVRIDQQAGMPIRRAGRGHGKAVRPDRIGRLVRPQKGIVRPQRDLLRPCLGEQFLEGLVEPVEERRLEHEARDHVPAGHRQHPVPHLPGVFRSPQIGSRRIAFCNLANMAGQGVIFCVQRRPDAEQVDEVIRHRRIHALVSGQITARGHHHFLKRCPVILRLRIGQAERHIAVPRPINMRHTPRIANDLHIKIRGRSLQRGKVRHVAAGIDP